MRLQITALVIGRLRLNEADMVKVRQAFDNACNAQRSPMSHAVRFLLKYLPNQTRSRVAF